MKYLRDGGVIASTARVLNGAPGPELLNQAMIYQNLVEGRLELSGIMLREFEVEAKYLLDLLHTHRLDKCGKSLELKFLNQDSFAAQVGGLDGQYGIEISVAVPLVALSVSVELCSLVDGSAIAGLSPNYRGANNSINDLFPQVVNPADIGFESLDLALDVTLLLFLHEMAHMMFGHCDYVCSNSAEHRALEFDADFNAGTMFSCWLQGLPHARRRASDFSEISSRLIRAAFLLGVILKAVSRATDEYHYPTVRVTTFMAGGAFGLESMGIAEKFEDEAVGNRYWDDLQSHNLKDLIGALKKSSLSRYLGTEEEIAKDIAELHNVTYAVRERLKDGPLKILAVPI